MYTFTLNTAKQQISTISPNSQYRVQPARFIYSKYSHIKRTKGFAGAVIGDYVF